MRHFNIARKAVSILANLSLLLNSFLPFVLAIQPVNAQSVEELSPTPTPVEIVENSPTPTPEIVISETPTPSPEITPEVTPEVTPEIIPEIEVTPEVTPTIEPTVTPENNQPQEPQNNNDNQNNNSPEVTPEVTPIVLPTITPTPNPVIKEVEQVCFSESDSIRNSVELDWNYDATNDIYESREKVQLGVKYIFPQDNKVTVTFSCLPKDELLRSTLKIKRVKTSDLKLPTIENIGDYAYDITTDMRDGSFKYDITLPKLSDSTAKVSYIEKSLEEAKLVAVSESEVKSIDNLEQQSDLVKATDVDHFTIFMVTGIWPTTSDNGLASGEGTSQIRWPKNKVTQSGLGFVGESGLNLETLTSSGNPFIFGTITHYNHPVSDAIYWADLKITLGLSTPKDFTFRVQIDETENDGSCPYGGSGQNCNDKVTFPNSISNQIVTVGGVDYTLVIDGFKKEINGVTLDSFITEENEDNIAYLVGHFTPVGRIIVDKITNPAGDNTSFSFTTTGAGYNSFSLTDSATPNNQILPANRNYSVSESTVSGWTKINTNCVSSIGDSEVASNLELDSGEVITCTFTNAKNVASLKVVKNVVPSNDSGKFNLFINSTKYASNIGNNGETGFITVSSGTATFSETAGTGTNLSDYTTTYSTGCDNGQTNLSIGETKTCTITNTRKAYCGDGIINGSETCDGSNLGSYSSTDFQCNKCSIELKQPKVTICHSTDSQTNPYRTEEPNKSADVSGHDDHNGVVWYPGVADHSWGDIIPPFAYIGGTFPGQNWTTEGQAIYNNDCNLPNSTLKIVKIVDNTGGGTKSATDFRFSLNGSSYTNFGIGGSNTFTLKIGDTYSVIENTEFSSSYGVSFNNCSGTIDSAQEVCTITNTYAPKCGDGIINSGEECDDANSVNTDACTNSCKNSVCGDGLIWTGHEICDDGADNDTTCSTTYGTVGSCSYCDASLCSIKTINNPICGDGIVDSDFGEECDDENSVNTDSCTNTCKAATCGDGFIQSGEECDGNNLGGLPSSDFSCNKKCELDLVEPKVTICHSTDSQTNPYRTEEPNKSADVSGHDDHNGVVWYPGVADHSWGDIIPPFAYIGGTFPGQNWTTEGQAIYNNDCKYPSGIINVVKVISNDATNYSDFSFSVNNESPTNFENDGSNQITANIGVTYNITETPNSDYEVSYDGCKDITVAKGETKTCTITNSKLAKLNVTKFNDFNGDGYQNGDEENLSDWIINLTGQTSVATNTDGVVSFEKLTPGNYNLSEDLSTKTDWIQTNIICDGEEGIDNDNSHQISLNYGQTLNCKIGNRQLGKVTVTKFNDLNGNGQKDDGESNLSNWTINLTNQTSLNTNESGQVVFNNLIPGNYDLSENVQTENGWKQTNIYCEDSGNGVKITAPGEAYGHHGNCGGWNSCGNAATCALWACEVKGYTNLVSYGADKPCTQFGNCNLFYSRGSVQYNWGNWCGVQGVTDIVCSNGSSSGEYYNNGNVSGSHLTINPGQNKVCYIGNQRLEPKTTITKSNNSGGVELNPGSSVEYSINVGLSDNSVNNLKVTDLLSNGFKYRVGSYKVYKNGNDVTSQITEPQYHSPGVWDLTALGILTPSDVIKLVYTADISTDQQAGKYADLAWSIANYAYDSNKTVLALAGSEGHVDTNFVGTEVAVGGNYQNSVSAEVKQENHVTGQVLGASTELPGTGAATIWLIISGLLGLVGFSFLKFNKKTMLTILLTLLSFGLIISPVRAETSNLSIRLEEPKTPSRIKEIELKYVALDIQGRGVTAYCLKKGPTDSSFVQFSSETLSGANGNASHCSLASAITDSGSYQFQVKAVAGGEESFSNTVSLDYNTSSPGTPIDYRKEQINNCDFKIHFKTADDSGKTVKVELYRSTDSNFSANNESLVVSTNIGSNQEKDIYNNVPDCSKTYFYALRAFDSAGNGSGLVGDKVYTTVTDGTTTVTSTTTNTGAIPVSGTILPKEENVDSEKSDTSSDQEGGQVLGTKTIEGNFFSRHPVTTILIAVLILGIIIYAFKKIRQSKKVFVKKGK